MRKTKAQFCAIIVDLVNKGQEEEAIKRFGYDNIWKVCKSFPKDKTVQTTLVKIEDEMFAPFEDFEM